MFGYIQPDLHSLNKEQQARYRRCYCGVCQALHSRYSQLGRMTLSYDMTFMAMLLDALYAEEEAAIHTRCPVHTLRGVDVIQSEIMAYAADMNVGLSYYKQLDNWQDDKNILSRGSAALLKRRIPQIRERYPHQIDSIEQWIDSIRAVEALNESRIDIPLNLTGSMLGDLFGLYDDVWQKELYSIGNGLGQFVYFMDAYEDLSRDRRTGNYNPLLTLSDREDFDAFCRTAMEAMLAEAADAFERLPIVRNADLIRNTLYSGVWLKLNRMQQKKRKGEDAK